MNVGDYVRTETGQIGKITYFEGDMVRVDCDKFITYKSNHNEITKISPNIIDLIEVGDIIKGIGNMIFSVINVDYKDKIIYGIDFWCEEKDIKSIVTKECFESMKYKVKE